MLQTWLAREQAGPGHKAHTFVSSPTACTPVQQVYLSDGLMQVVSDAPPWLFFRRAVSWAGGHNVRPPVGAVAVGARVAGRQETAFADSCSFLLHLIRDQML